MSDVGSRYRDAYQVANTTTVIGRFVKYAGLVGGGAIAFIALTAYNELHVPSWLALVGVVIGAVIGVVVFVFGLLVAAGGQILKAVLDCAVNSTPFLTHQEKAEVMSITLGTVSRSSDATAVPAPTAPTLEMERCPECGGRLTSTGTRIKCVQCSFTLEK